MHCSRSAPFCIVFALFLASCGANDPITGPGVVDTSSVFDSAEDATPTSDTGNMSDVAGGACTVSSDCPGATDLCLAGACVPQTACASDKQCQASGQVCDMQAGVCVTCLSDTDCPKGQSCKANKCLAPPTPCQTTKGCPADSVCDKSLGVCVACVSAPDCPANMACKETVCVPMVCKPGTAKCASSASLTVCAADGSAWTTSQCGGDKTCLNNTCKPVICAPNQKSCDGALKVVLCDATGTALSQADLCDPTSNAKNVCLGGQCVPMACQAGSAICADPQTLATCKSDGTGYDNQKCGIGLACDAGKCISAICKPFAAMCSDNKVAICNASGTGASPSDDCTAKQQTCVDGACQKLVCAAGTFSCSGTTFGTCNGDGMGYTTKLCNDGDACTTDGCDTTKGCTTTALGCDDGNGCTIDSCDKVKGCIHTTTCCTTNADCDDKDPCTTDTCVAGTPSSCAHAAIDGPNCCNPIVWSADFEDGSTHGGISGNGGPGNGWQVWNGSGKAQSGVSVLYYGSPVTQNYAFGPNGINSGSWVFSTALPNATKLTLKFKIYPAIESDPAFDTFSLLGQFNTIWSKATAGLLYSAWNIVALDISNLKGTANANFQLNFDTVDASNNGTLGILIDDVQVIRSCP